MPLRGGGPGAAFPGSLAEELEKALDQVRVEHGLGTLPAEGREDRRMLFIAIARGIVTYLGDHETDFVVRRHNSGDARHTNTTDGYVEIRTT